MSSLREIRDRISSVRGTLKITSAMKLVASSKLRRAQKAIETMLPYEKMLSDIIAQLRLSEKECESLLSRPEGGRKAVILITGNSSMCGGFNANAARKALGLMEEGVEVYALGRKGADIMRRSGYPSVGDFSGIVSKPDFSEVSELSGRLSSGYREVTLVYNHFVSNSRQEVVAKSLFEKIVSAPSDTVSDDDTYILEPGRGEIMETVVPKLLALRIFSAILDSAAAEHAARMVAMQTATDNAKELLSDLTLDYNKGRQQKITSEILDLLGGSAQ